MRLSRKWPTIRSLRRQLSEYSIFFKNQKLFENLEKHAAILKPDLVILDFGTNDILFKNAIDEKLSDQIEKSINRFRAINPEILIVLTSTQDLFYKKKK